MDNLLFWKNFTDLLFYLDEVKNNILPESISDAEEIIDFRGNLRLKVNSIQDICEDLHGTKTTYYITFPIVVYCDEFISKIFAESSLTWPKLQKEIYNTEDGGEKIYELIDQLIEQPTFPEIVYQTNYVILKTDFKGKLVDENTQKTKAYYLKKIENLLVSYQRHNVSVADVAPNIYKTPYEKLKEYSRKYYYIPAIGAVGIIYLSAILILAT
ncbi:MAG: DotU family type IV/VI secretion system protein [bacterium]|nr:DotU family type IV/VI secretion system protein [bacterium]